MSISVIIPAFNRVDLIAETFDSILNQNLKPDEIIVVDDGSTDGTAELAEKYHKLIRVVRQQNQGAGAARNRGFRESIGEFIHFMDSDDICTLNKYEIQHAALKQSGADLAYSPWVKTAFEGRKIQFHKVAVQQRPVPAQPGLDTWLLRGWMSMFQPFLIRRDLIERAGPYRTDLMPSEDAELLYRIGKLKPRMVHTPETILLYRWHENMLSASPKTKLARAVDWARFLILIENDLLVCSKSLEIQSRLWVEDQKQIVLDVIADHAPEVKNTLMKTINPVSGTISKLTRPLRRIRSKIRRMKYGENHLAALGPGELTESQYELIRQAGYTCK